MFHIIKPTKPQINWAILYKNNNFHLLQMLPKEITYLKLLDWRNSLFLIQLICRIIILIIILKDHNITNRIINILKIQAWMILITKLNISSIGTPIAHQSSILLNIHYRVTSSLLINKKYHNIYIIEIQILWSTPLRIFISVLFLISTR